jgi:hypothetical protein
MKKKTDTKKEKIAKTRNLRRPIEDSFPGSDPISIAQPAPDSGTKT